MPENKNDLDLNGRRRREVATNIAEVSKKTPLDEPLVAELGVIEEEEEED